MVRYLGQRDTFRCAPIMIINLMKWAGYHATEKELLSKLCSKMNTTLLEGTLDEKVDAQMRKIRGVKIGGPRYTKTCKPIREALKVGKAVVIAHWWKTKESFSDGHVFLCIGYKRGYYTVVNEGESIYTVTEIQAREMRNLLRRKGTKTWIVEKEEE